MKILKIAGILLAVYVGIVVLFESLLGYFQPTQGNTLVITTTNADGQQNDRVVTAIDDEGTLYVAVNHWPRAWYRALQKNPQVGIDRGQGRVDHLAVPVSDEVHERLDTEVRPLSFTMRFLTGFPPRYFVRLDPLEADS
jgi:hypothetical protein